MMFRTHVAIAFFVALIFVQQVNNKAIFLVVMLVATLLPDIDSGMSVVGRSKGAGFIRFFTQHRGIFHSLSVAVILSVVLAYIFPIAALPFFLGYTVHLFSDSFTVEGIQPFWPYKGKISGRIRVGGAFETTLFSFLLILDVLMIIFILG